VTAVLLHRPAHATNHVNTTNAVLGCESPPATRASVLASPDSFTSWQVVTHASPRVRNWLLQAACSSTELGATASLSQQQLGSP
jgi:hypothetical protein